MDFLQLVKGKVGYENVLVVTDSFTKFAWAFATRNQKANVVARILWDNILANYGFPRSPSIQTKEGTLSQRSSNNCANLWEYKKPE